jgi:hypothetical protein
MQAQREGMVEGHRTEAAEPRVRPAGAPSLENPFTRSFASPVAGRCVKARIFSRDSAATLHVRLTNRCKYPVAVLTAPLEVRVRLKAEERFINERMPWAAYAILYVFPAALGVDAFRGSDIVLDGGLRVARPPSYITVDAGADVDAPLACDLQVPPGQYLINLWTYEAPQGDAEWEVSGFDCQRTVDVENARGTKSAKVELGSDVTGVTAGSTVTRLPFVQ